MDTTLLRFYWLEVPFWAPYIAVLLASLSLLPNSAYLSQRRIIDNYFSYLLLFTCGVEGIWQAINHLWFGQLNAEILGWANSPFQSQLAYAYLALGLLAIISFFYRHRVFRSAVMIFVIVFLFVPSLMMIVDDNRDSLELLRSHAIENIATAIMLVILYTLSLMMRQFKQ